MKARAIYEKHIAYFENNIVEMDTTSRFKGEILVINTSQQGAQEMVA